VLWSLKSIAVAMSFQKQVVVVPSGVTAKMYSECEISHLVMETKMRRMNMMGQSHFLRGPPENARRMQILQNILNTSSDVNEKWRAVRECADTWEECDWISEELHVAHGKSHAPHMSNVVLPNNGQCQGPLQQVHVP